MKKLLTIVGGLLVVVLLAAVAVYAWARYKDHVLLSRTIATHRVTFPIPVPLSDAEVQEIRAGRLAAGQPGPTDQELADIARQRAVERGKHLVEARYTCRACHGQNFAGGTMIDAFPIGTLLGPNITAGRGSRTVSYTAADWDRAVRHGVKPDGTPSIMPAEEFQHMSDEELSDVVSFIRSQPAVDVETARPRIGPLGAVLLATGKITLAADVIPTHTAAHSVAAPVEEVSLEFGQHLAAVCSGCHRPTFSGGPIPGGDPSWPPSANLTRHADGLAGWTYDTFKATITTGTKPDGTALKAPMSDVLTFVRQMNDTELQAIWKYLESLPPVPKPAS
jgi:mono/diheme cytochrome c family protein